MEKGIELAGGKGFIKVEFNTEDTPLPEWVCQTIIAIIAIPIFWLCIVVLFAATN